MIFLYLSLNFFRSSLSLMAMRHRKLFPVGTPINQTTDCPDFCYPYSDYFLLPPPPPPLSPLSSHEHHISPYVIILVSVVASLFLIVSYYVIVAKSCSGWCGSNNRQPQNQADNTDEEFLDENRVDHPIWFITTIGLQQSIINSIAVCRYKKGEGLIEGSECSVCLSEFQQDENLRLLPKCNHAFHISCIDTWLRSHTNCPLCRARIINDAVATPLVSVNQTRDNSSPVVRTQMVNSDMDSGLQERNEPRQNRTRTGTEEGGGTPNPQVGEEINLKGDLNSNDNGGVQESSRDSVDEYQKMENRIQPMRRSSSMDSLRAATMSMCTGQTDHSAVESDANLVYQLENSEGRNSNIVLKRNGSSSIPRCLHKGPVSMKRSMSCGGRFFSSRPNRSLSSILPS